MLPVEISVLTPSGTGGNDASWDGHSLGGILWHKETTLKLERSCNKLEGVLPMQGVSGRS